MSLNQSDKPADLPVIRKNVNLQPYNTLGVEALAEKFLVLDNADQLPELYSEKVFDNEVWVLGGGSNVLFSNIVKPLILKNEINFFEIINQNRGTVTIKSGGGMDWHKLVTYCVQNKWGGIENLALIPGTVGAAPIQNIGAYGVELGDIFQSLEAFDMQSGQFRDFDKTACGFGYRDSVFKREFSGRFIITSVTLQLQKPPHTVNREYKSLDEWLRSNKIDAPSISDIYNGVVEIRMNKLPDPADLGNAGSFFKNPVITTTLLDQLRGTYPDMPYYPLSGDSVKIPAGWLIEKAGWKGKRVGRVGTYENQALVIVNHGGASGDEIWSLAQNISKSVEQNFGIELMPEVNIVG